jgi:hypothetical protein
MDFIERLFGIAPDGGSGSLEFLLIAIPVSGLLYLAFRRIATVRSRRRSQRRVLRT